MSSERKTADAGLGKTPTGPSEPRAEAAAQASIKSVATAMGVLLPLLAAGGEMALGDIARESKVAAPKAHRYLASLIKAGLVSQDRAMGTYRLGPMAVRIGLAALGFLDPGAELRRAMHDLSARTGLSACVTLPVSEGALVMDVAVPASTLFVGLRVGAVLPERGSAAGRVLAAHRLPFSADPDAQAIRASGYAAVRNLVMPGMSGVAAPVFDRSGRAAFALALFGPTDGFELAASGQPVRSLLLATGQLSRNLGHPA